MLINGPGQTAALFGGIPPTAWSDLRDCLDYEIFLWVLKSIHLSPGEGTQPATPRLPEDTGKEDAKETFKGNQGMDGTLLGKIDDGPLLIAGHPGYVLAFLLFCSYLKNELDRASVTLQKAREVLGFDGETTGGE